jgi:hypothetical protein
MDPRIGDEALTPERLTELHRRLQQPRGVPTIDQPATYDLPPPRGGGRRP